MTQDNVISPKYDIFRNAKFDCLGFNGDKYYYYNREKQTIVELTTPQHTKPYLLGLENLSFWEGNFGGRGWLDAAVDSLMQVCRDIGPFNHEVVRGRGAWMDDNKTIYHFGNGVYLGETGDILRPCDVESKYIYELKPKINVNPDPLSSADALKVLTACTNNLGWGKPSDGILLAGWLVCASICGALDWRPHIWITGERGTGKSKILENVVKPILGDTCLYVSSTTTASGIQFKMKNDSLAVVFEEAEAERDAHLKRMEDVLFLARNASSESEAEVLKGNPRGEARSYKTRSCFCMASINSVLSYSADRSRFTILTLNSNVTMKLDYEKFLETTRMFRENDFSGKFLNRNLQQIELIKNAAKTFSKLLKAIVCDSRTADQYAAKLAGAYSLTATDFISEEKAKDWINKINWNYIHEDALEQMDTVLLVQTLFNNSVRVRSGNFNFFERIGVLVDIAMGDKYDTNITAKTADEILRNTGIIVDRDEKRVNISNTSTSIASLLRGTPWATNWSKVLLRIEGAVAEKTKSYGFKANVARGVSFSMNLLVSAEPEELQLEDLL